MTSVNEPLRGTPLPASPAQNAALAANGQISFQGQVGQTYTVTVTLSCGGQILTGSTQITLQFDLSKDIDGAAREVQAAINASRADLPDRKSVV